MTNSAAQINEEIAGAVEKLGFDWRTSWAKVVTDTSGKLHVSVSRREIYEELRPRADVEIELAGSSSANILWAVSSVVDVRREPEHSSELLTQAIMGEMMVRLDLRGDWYLVMLDDGYHGWVRSWNVGEFPRETAESYGEQAGSMVSASVAYVLAEPKAGSLPVSDVTAGSIVVTGDIIDGYAAVELPGGRSGFLEAGALEDLPEGPAAREALLERARRFLGIPYIWGGTSAKGFDCSGLVKRVFRMEGIETPRDADQQSATGSPVEAAAGMIPEASLLFFGEGGRIT
ncbi:MAG: C40 family peptidase, partial [Candidatus Krumholzibacteria bacterium]|nr:C40 family peptidase [Candidatus Krumholzibacteria bacterium]